MDNSTLIPITSFIDTSRIKNMDISSPEFKEYLISLTENLNNILQAVNAKDVGIYNNEETTTGQIFYDSSSDEARASYRKFIDCGALLDTATKQIAHNLDATWGYKMTRIYGVTSDTTNKVYLPIPYASSTATDIIELYLDNTNINITTGKDRTSFDTTYVVIEYKEI